MQLKRALKRLESHLATGRTLSATALGSALTLSLASAPPAKAGTLLATQVLTQASSLSTTSIFTNTILTMNSIQKSIAAGALLVAATAVPAIQMASETSRLQTELSVVETQNEPVAKQQSKTGSFSRSQRPARTAYDVLKEYQGPVDASTLLRTVAEMKNGANLVELYSLCIPIFDLNEAELSLLRKDIADYPSYSDEKEIALALIEQVREVSGASNHQSQLEELLATGSSPDSLIPLLQQWASKNPTEALAWFQEKDRQGNFNGKGIEEPRTRIFAALIAKTLISDPILAEKLYRDAKKEVKTLVSSELTTQISQEIATTETTKSLETFLSIEPDIAVQQQVTLTAAIVMSFKTGNLDDGLKVLQLADGELPAFPSPLASLASTSKTLSLDQKISWLEGHLSESDLKANIPLIFTPDLVGQNEIEQWLEKNPTSSFGDEIRGSLADDMIYERDFQSAREQVEFISDEDKRASLLDTIERAEKRTP